jgi:hypothetical protein
MSKAIWGTNNAHLHLIFRTMPSTHLEEAGRQAGRLLWGYNNTQQYSSSSSVALAVACVCVRVCVCVCMCVHLCFTS